MDQRNALAGKGSGKRQLAHAFRKRHHGRECHRWMPANEDIHPQRLASAGGSRVMNADAAMNLIMQADFAIGHVRAARKLQTVHAEIRVRYARLAYVLGVALWQRDKCAGVVGPTLELRELADRRLVFEDRTASHTPRLHSPRRQWRCSVAERLPQASTWIDLQLDRPPHVLIGMPKEIASPLEGAEQVRHHRKTAALHVGI